jgi:hypothetical protein
MELDQVVRVVAFMPRRRWVSKALSHQPPTTGIRSSAVGE